MNFRGWMIGKLAEVRVNERLAANLRVSEFEKATA